MKPGTGLPIQIPPSKKPWWQRILGQPDTRLGWWSVSLTAVFIAFFMINAAVFMPNKIVVPW